MAGPVTVKIAGLSETDAALGELSKATARNVLRRVLKKAGQPMADRMAELAPDDPNTPAPDLHTSIVVSPSLKNPVGRAEFAAVKAAGGSNAEAVRALRDARRAAAGGDYFAEIYVGPDAKVYYAHLVEFGTAHSSPEPYARPAFDETKKQVLDGIVNGLKPEIDKAIARVRARAAKAAK